MLPLKTAHGQLEDVRVEGADLILRGWALDPFLPFDEIALELDGQPIHRRRPSLVPAVAHNFPHLEHAAHSGYECRVPHGGRFDRLLPLTVTAFADGQPVARQRRHLHLPSRAPVLAPAELRLRVAGTDDVVHFYQMGLNSALDLLRAAEAHVEPGRLKRVLDWGCGCGRVAAHLERLRPDLQLSGCDIDAQGVAWCREHLQGDFQAIDPMPPLPYPDASFDAVFGVSVMAHLTAEVQAAWLLELRRVLRPGGLLALSVHGPFEIDMKPSPPPGLLQRGISDVVRDPRLDGIAPKDYYRGTYQTYDYTVQVWGQLFEMIDLVDGGLACLQDLVLLRRPLVDVGPIGLPTLPPLQADPTGGAPEPHRAWRWAVEKTLSLGPALYPLTRHLSNAAFRKAVKRVLRGQSSLAHELRQRRATAKGGAPLSAGVSLLGCSRAENGIGESCRLAVASLATTTVPFGVVNLPFSQHCRQGELRATPYEIPFPAHRVNLLHMNPPEMAVTRDLLGDRALDGRINIGIWHWELPQLPADWKPYLDRLDELWAPSRFIEQCLLDAGKREVRFMPHGLSLPPFKPFHRSELGLPRDSTLFFFMFDTMSFQERKNPEGAIRAFKQAFQADSKATLLIKLNNAQYHQDKVGALEALADGWPNIRFLKRGLDRSRVLALIQASDCFVSLHRSEGFGLGPAEALALGKPVIATDWSSTTDFIRPEHACPVGYELVKVGKDVGPYEAWQEWAEPDLDDAARWMRKVHEDRDWARLLGQKGAAFMAEEYSAQRAGERMRQRLQELGAL